jgi:phospholipase C
MKSSAILFTLDSRLAHVVSINLGSASYCLNSEESNGSTLQTPCCVDDGKPLLDHLLGFLPGVNGLSGNETNPLSANGPLVRVSRNARTVHDLIPDPGHEFVNVNVQIFGNSDGTDTGQPKMQGFVQDYALVSNESLQGANVMKCFTPETLPVLSTLAKEYAVSDSWYASVPGSTIPNRLFAHGATSDGSLTQDVIVLLRHCTRSLR